MAEYEEQLRLTVTLNDNASAKLAKINDQIAQLGRGQVSGAMDRLHGSTAVAVTNFLGMSKFFQQATEATERATGYTEETEGRIKQVAEWARTATEGIKTIGDKMISLSELSRELGIPMARIKAVQEAFERMGIPMARTNAFLRDLNDTMLELSKEGSQLQGQMMAYTAGDRRMSDAMIDYFKKLNVAARQGDETKTLKLLKEMYDNVYQAKLRETEGNEQLSRAWAGGFIKHFTSDPDLFARPFEEIAKTSKEQEDRLQRMNDMMLEYRLMQAITQQHWGSVKDKLGELAIEVGFLNIMRQALDILVATENAIMAIVNGLTQATAWVKKLYGKNKAFLFGILRKLLGVAGVKIPGLQAGGIVTRPTTALVGEGGPEAIIPLGHGGLGGLGHPSLALSKNTRQLEKETRMTTALTDQVKRVNDLFEGKTPTKLASLGIPIGGGLGGGGIGGRGAGGMPGPGGAGPGAAGAGPSGGAGPPIMAGAPPSPGPPTYAGGTFPAITGPGAELGRRLGFGITGGAGFGGTPEAVAKQLGAMPFGPQGEQKAGGPGAVALPPGIGGDLGKRMGAGLGPMGGGPVGLATMPAAAAGYGATGPTAATGGGITGPTSIAALERDPQAQAAIARFAQAFPNVKNPKTQLYSLIAGESNFGRDMGRRNYRGYLQLGKEEAYGRMGLTGDQFSALPFHQQLDAYTAWARQNDPTGQKITDLGLFNAASAMKWQNMSDDTVIYPANSRAAQANAPTWGRYSNAGGAITIGGIKAYYARNDPTTNRAVAAAGGTDQPSQPTGQPSVQVASTGSTQIPGAAGDPTIPTQILQKAREIALQGGPAAVSKFMRDQGYPKHDAWCGDFAASVVKSVGGYVPPHPEVASNWRLGRYKVDTPQPGDVAVRVGTPTGSTTPHGHVTFPYNYDPKTKTFTGLGGNQGQFESTFHAGNRPGEYEFYRRDYAPQVTAWDKPISVSEAIKQSQIGLGSSLRMESSKTSTESFLDSMEKLDKERAEMDKQAGGQINGKARVDAKVMIDVMTKKEKPQIKTDTEAKGVTTEVTREKGKPAAPEPAKEATPAKEAKNEEPALPPGP